MRQRATIPQGRRSPSRLRTTLVIALNIVQCPSREGFLDELLVEPGLVDQELVADLQSIFRVSRAENRGVGFSRGGLILHDIDQPFVTEVHMPCIAARLVTRQSVQMMKNIYMFWPEAGHAKLSTSPPPFSGIFGSISDRIG
jgi:hypothetical protein